MIKKGTGIVGHSGCAAGTLAPYIRETSITIVSLGTTNRLAGAIHVRQGSTRTNIIKGGAKVVQRANIKIRMSLQLQFVKPALLVNMHPLKKMLVEIVNLVNFKNC